MKKNKLFITAGLMALALTGCTNLDVNIDSQYTEDPSKEGGVDPMLVVEAKMADVYFHLSGCLGRRYMEAQALSSDEFTALAFDGGYYDDGTYAHTALHCNTAEDATLDWYSDVTAGITKANQILEELGSGASPQMTAPPRAIRAYFTWILMDSFGDTPILDKIPAEGVVVQRSPRKDVALWLEKELNAVIPQLTTDVNANTYGKPTRWMAEALLAKIHINWPVYTADAVENYDATTAVNEKLDECIALCEDIEKGPFSLGSMEYRFKFAPDNGPQVEDFIYAMPYDAIDRQGMQYARPRSFKQLKNMLPNYYGSSEKFTQSFGGNMVVTPEFAELFSLEGDQRNLSILAGDVFNRDPKTLLPTTEPFMYDGKQVSFSKKINLIKQDNTIDVGGDGIQQGYHSIKWFIVPNDYNNERNQSNDVPIFRYADILLTKAEALIRKGGAKEAEEAMKAFNKVRAYAKAPQLTAAPTLKEILDERGRELFDENWRRNDLIRFGEFESEFFPHYKNFPDANFDKRHRIFPVEKEMLDLNEGWKQNPGY